MEMTGRGVTSCGCGLQVMGEPIDEDYMRSKLSELVPAITRGYCHSESSVRKASVFCLVAVYRIVGEDMKDHLPKLSSSQVRVCRCVHL